MPPRPLLLALPLALALAACSSAPAPSGPGPGDLTGTRWELARWLEGGKSLRPIPHSETGDPVTLQFSEQNGKKAIAGFSGCNQYTGGYEVTGDRLSAPRLAVTKRACVTPQRTQIETEYLKALDDGVSASRTDTRNGPELTFKTENGDVLVFEPK